MRRLLGWVGAALLAVGIAGCAGAAKSGMPCERCRYGVQSVGKAQPPRIFCVVDGKEVDCRKNPEACPDCRKHMSEMDKK